MLPQLQSQNVFPLQIYNTWRRAICALSCCGHEILEATQSHQGATLSDMKRTILTILGWWGAVSLLIASQIGICMEFSLFSWHPHLSEDVEWCVLGIIVACVSIIFLARIKMSQIAIFVSSIPCIVALTIGVIAGQSPAWWYSCPMIAVAALPISIWTLVAWRSTRDL